MSDPLIFGLELGGTKCLAVRARGTAILDSILVPTSDPATTLAEVDAIFERWFRQAPPAAVGIASFGPVAVDRERADWGHVLETPKRGWAGTDLAGRYQRLLHVPTQFDTDVNAAALAEARWGGAVGTSSSAYITLGTGVGVGLVVNGAPVHGWMHPEFGHLRARRRAGDGFAGTCAFHGDCIEGLISGPAIAARSGIRGELVADDAAIWDDISHDLGELLAALILAVSPQHIALGGGIVCARPWLVARGREAAVTSLAGYVKGLPEAMETMIDITALGDKAGPLGAIALGLAAISSC